MTCVARGNPQPAIKWFQNKKEIPGAVTSYYIIDELRLQTRGQYYCNASNDEGTSCSDTVIVKIRGELAHAHRHSQTIIFCHTPSNGLTVCGTVTMLSITDGFSPQQTLV